MLRPGARKSTAAGARRPATCASTAASRTTRDDNAIETRGSDPSRTTRVNRGGISEGLLFNLSGVHLRLEERSAKRVLQEDDQFLDQDQNDHSALESLELWKCRVSELRCRDEELESAPVEHRDEEA